MSGVVLNPPTLEPVNDVPAPSPMSWEQELALRDRALIFALDSFRLTTDRTDEINPDAVIEYAELFYEYLVNGVQGE
jgi:hypothetical protein